jgi:hypothetical protein
MKLDDIRAAVEAKYAVFPVEIGEGQVVNLLNALRVDASKRDRLVGLRDKLKADGADQVALVEDALRAVAETPTAGEKLIQAVNHDLAVLMELFAEYAKATQVGEASASHE